jgi:3-oxoadipate enol-lactonase
VIVGAMANVVRTGVEFAEPLGVLRRSPELVVPFGRRAGTTLDKPATWLPPGRVEGVEGSGQIFFRDTGRPRGRSRGTIVLLHGWMVPSDAHWFRTFEVLHKRGWRVIALDARGHGRGLRTVKHFRFSDCAADVINLVRHLDCGPVTLVGYSMGGIIAQLVARNAPQLVDGMVLCATGCEFRTSAIMRGVWSSMGALQVGWRLAPRSSWLALTRLAVQTDREVVEWAVAELSRGAAWDIAEAGREIGRFDSRPWLSEVVVPAVVVVTLADLLVPPARQREVAALLDAPIVELRADHLAPGTTPSRFHRALLDGLAELQRSRVTAVA